MNKGWIKSYRSILDNPVVTKSTDHMAVWVFLTHTAACRKHKAVFKGEEIILKPGQLITGRKKISEKYKNLSESKVQRILKDFENARQIEQQTSSQNRLITLLNWEKYQINEQLFEQQVNNDFDKNYNLQSEKLPNSDIKVNNKNDGGSGLNTGFSIITENLPNNVLNNERTTSEQRVNNERTHNKNDKECKRMIKNEREDTHAPLGRFKNVILKQSELDELKAKFPNDYEAKIERLSRYLESTGKTYRNHFSTLLDWLEKDTANNDKDKKSTSSYDIDKLEQITPLKFGTDYD